MSRVLQARIRNYDLYGKKTIRIPAPRFVVFYNGTDEQPEKRVLRLSGSFEKRMSFPQAVEQAVDYCIGQGILSDFLVKNRAEAIAVCIFEYDEEKHLKNEREWAYNEGKMEGKMEGKAEGISEGKIEGINETLVKNVEAVMRNFNINLQAACEGLGISIEEYEKAKTQTIHSDCKIVENVDKIEKE